MSEICKAKRITYYDFLKTIGMICIVIAHVNTSGLVHQLRNFDVPLMVILSSSLTGMSYERKYLPIQKDMEFICSRVMRLACPTWFFLVFYFLFLRALGIVFNVDYYKWSFLLTSYGMGYVWVIRIYIFCSALIPMFYRFRLGIIPIISLYIVYEITWYYQVGTDSIFLMSTWYYIIPYGTLAYLGCRIREIDRNGKKRLLVISFVVFMTLAVMYGYKTGSFVPTQTAKYPPRIYFLSYGIMCSLLLLLICEKYRESKFFENVLFRFVSNHSMWIYLWHIFVLFVFEYKEMHLAWIPKVVAILSCSVMIVFVQNIIVRLLERRFKISFLKYLK